MVLDDSLTAVLTLVSGEFAVIYSFHELYKLILVYSISKGVSLQYTLHYDLRPRSKLKVNELLGPICEFAQFINFAAHFVNS